MSLPPEAQTLIDQLRIVLGYQAVHLAKLEIDFSRDDKLAQTVTAKLHPMRRKHDKERD